MLRGLSVEPGLWCGVCVDQQYVLDPERTTRPPVQPRAVNDSIIPGYDCDSRTSSILAAMQPKHKAKLLPGGLENANPILEALQGGHHIEMALGRIEQIARKNIFCFQGPSSPSILYLALPNSKKISLNP